MARELPNNVPYPAKVKLILKFQHSWMKHADACLDGVRDNLADTVLECVRQHFERWDSLHVQLRWVKLYRNIGHSV